MRAKIWTFTESPSHGWDDTRLSCATGMNSFENPVISIAREPNQHAFGQGSLLPRSPLAGGRIAITPLAAVPICTDVASDLYLRPSLVCADLSRSVSFGVGTLKCWHAELGVTVLPSSNRLSPKPRSAASGDPISSAPRLHWRRAIENGGQYLCATAMNTPYISARSLPV